VKGMKKREGKKGDVTVVPYYVYKHDCRKLKANYYYD